MKKRIFSLVLALVMCLSLVPVTAMAASSFDELLSYKTRKSDSKVYFEITDADLNLIRAACDSELPDELAGKYYFPNAKEAADFISGVKEVLTGDASAFLPITIRMLDTYGAKQYPQAWVTELDASLYRKYCEGLEVAFAFDAFHPADKELAFSALGGDIGSDQPEDLARMEEVLKQFKDSGVDLEYKTCDWNCDFEVTFDRDVAANTLELAGSFPYGFDGGGAWDIGAKWLKFSALNNIETGKALRLLGGYGLDCDYLFILSILQFNCGVIANPDYAGTNMTVNLYMYETKDWHETGTKFLICSYNHTIGAVARLNDTDYISFAAAVKAAKPGDTIRILNDFELTEPVIIDKDVNVILGSNQPSMGVGGAFTVKAGTYDVNPSAFVASGYEAIQIDAGNHQYLVRPVKPQEEKQQETITVDDQENSVATDSVGVAQVTKAVEKEVGTVVVAKPEKPASGSVQKAIEKADNGDSEHVIANAIKAAAASGSDIEITVATVVKVDAAQSETVDAIQEVASNSNYTLLKSVEVTVNETVTVFSSNTDVQLTTSVTSAIAETEEYQYITIPFDESTASGTNIIVYRQHEDDITTMAKAADEQKGKAYNGECYWIDGSTVVIKANKFSTYSLALAPTAVAVTAEPTTPAPTPAHHGGSGYSGTQTVTTDLKDISVVKVDGKVVDSKYYTISGGSVTLNSDYLKTLSNGKHSFSAENATHISRATFTVQNGTAVKSVKTGDMGIALYGALAVCSVLGLGWVGKKKYSAE